MPALNPEQEQEMVGQIREQYISPGFSYPRKVRQILANRISGATVPEKDAWDSDGREDDDTDILRSDDESEDEPETKKKIRHKKPPFTRYWPEGFLHRNHLSLRRPNMRRRPLINNEKVATFLADVERAFAEYVRCNMYNLDETHSALINAHQITIASRGQKGVAAKLNADPKMGITAIAILSAAGEKMPL
jgi:hypothetical protein